MYKTISFQKILLYLIILMGTGGLGLFDRIISISTPMGILTESLIIIPFLFIINFKDIVRLNHFSIELLPYTLYIILLLFKVFQNIVFDNLPLPFIINHIRPFIGIFTIYLFIVKFRSKKDIVNLFKYLLLLALLSSILSIYQYLTGDFFDSKFFSVSYADGALRFYHRSIWLIALMLIFIIISFGVTRIINGKRAFIYSFLMAATIVFTMTRSVIIAIVLSLTMTLFAIIRYSKRALNRVFKLSIYSVLGLVLIYYSLNLLGYRFDGIINRFQEGLFAVQNPNYDDKSHNIRKEMVAFQFINVINDSPLTGRGLNIVIVEIDGPENYFEPFARNEDATYQNIMIYFGISGLIILLILFYSYLKAGKNLIKVSNNRIFETIGVFCFILPIFFLFIGFYGDYFNYIGFCTFAIFSSVIYNLKRNVK